MPDDITALAAEAWRRELWVRACEEDLDSHPSLWVAPTHHKPAKDAAAAKRKRQMAKAARKKARR